MKRIWAGLGAAALLAAAFFGARAFMGSGEIPPPQPAEVRRLIVEAHGDCGPELCRELTVVTEPEGDGWTAVATYQGLYDDSVAASRLRIPLEYENGRWTLGEPVEQSWRCGRPDSPPDFTTELCP